jgi:myo-inositol 2-dehydrogenase/D-chiro-inositol 1-dehydrogenase
LVRLGIVGLGAVAQLVYLPIIARLPDLFSIRALCDLSPGLLTQIGDRFGLPPHRRYQSLEELLEDGEVEAVLLLISGSHGRAARLVLEAGLPVLCEKPLAYTLAEADALPSSPALQLGYMKLHDPAVEEAGRLFPGLAPLRSVDVVVLHPSMEEQIRALPPLSLPEDVEAGVLDALAARTAELCRQAIGPAAERFGLLYTEVLVGSLVHELAIIRRLAGDPTRIDFADVWPPGSWPPSVAILGELPGGARLSIRWHYLEHHPAYREQLSFHTERETLSLVFPSPYLLHAPTTLTLTTRQEAAARASTFRSAVEAFERQLVAFHRLVLKGGSPAAGIAEGRADIVTCQRIVATLAHREGLEVGGEAAPP